MVVPPRIIERMQAASAQGREAGLAEGIAIAPEMREQVRPFVQGIQVSAPFGKVPFALQVFDGIPGIDPNVSAQVLEPRDTLGIAPPAPITVPPPDAI